MGGQERKIIKFVYSDPKRWSEVEVTSVEIDLGPEEKDRWRVLAVEYIPRVEYYGRRRNASSVLTEGPHNTDS